LLKSIDTSVDQYYPPTRSLIAGANYSVNTLLQLMVQESDNQAAQTLNASVNEKIITDVYDNFGSPRAFDETKDLVSPKVYMRFFRILYNASYLTRSSSQQALGLLSKTKFTEGLVAGIPKDRTIAHKFGERTVLSKDPVTGALTVKNHELHDCGIIYYPQKPYGICIMTEGKDFTALAKVIAEISRVTYAAVDAGFLTYDSR
jgi:beta-lactamase class A